MANRRKGRGRRRGILIALATVVLALVAVRIALPSFLQDYVNGKLDEIPEYDGHVGDIDIALFRGAYTIQDVKLVKTNRQVEIPFVEADRVDLSVQWGALMEGSWVGEITFERARLNFVSGPSKEESQKSIDDSWLPAVEDLFPLRINKFEITDSEIHYRDVRRDPELAAADGRIDGYVKPIFHDVDIVDVEEDGENPLELVWESVVGLVGKLFTNQSKDQMATTVPIHGRTDQPDSNLLSIITGLLRNAFIETLKPGVEGTVDLDKDSDKKQEAEKEAREELEEEQAED